jgi:diacylglycerol kinase family enzyme
MGVLPLGTLNHFAKDLKIPLELESAVATVLTGRVVRIDVGEVNVHLFVNNSSLGIYPWIVRERETEQRKGYGKWQAPFGGFG